MFRRMIFVLAAALIISGTAFAAHPLITDDTGTQGKGKFQLEVNSEFNNEKERQYNADEDKWQTKTQTERTYGTHLLLQRLRLSKT